MLALLMKKLKYHRAPQRTLLIKLVVAFVIPTVTLFSIFAFFSYELQREQLDEELGRRLEAVASAASTRLRAKYLLDLEAGDETDSLYYEGGMRRLTRVKKATGIERLYVFDKEFFTRLDTSGRAIGAKQYQAESDRSEILRLFDTGKPVSSVLFEGVDGRSYKAGYAALHLSEDDPKVVLILGVDAPVDFFDRLSDLRRQLIFYGLLLVVAVATLAVMMGLRITRPLRSLANAAERIGGGELLQSIPVLSNDEIGLLAMTMEKMRVDLRTRDQRLQMMLAGIAHEVRNPLGGMELFCGILRDELEDEPEALSHVRRVEKEIGHLKVVVEDFLEYARRPAPDMKRLDLGLMIKEVVEMELSEAKVAGVELLLKVKSVFCQGDEHQLNRAMLNLLRNAIQAGQGGEHPITLEVGQFDDTLVFLSILNFGSVIQAKDHDKLFDPFFTTKEKGTGLGLAFVKEIIEDHRGTIQVTSDNVNGTLFTINLPALAQSMQSETPS